MNELKVFENERFGEIRVVEVDDQPWFVAKDVCDILDISNPTKAVSRLDEDERSNFKLGRQGETNIVNEYGLYSLILGSRKKEAKEFKRWVTHEVIPSIRKHGGYLTDEKIEEVLMDPDTIIKLATQLKEERILNKKQQQIIGELKPRADYTDRILKNKGLVTITQIAKDYGMSGQAMNDLLHKLKVQYKQSGQWLLYREHQGKGYTHSETVDITRKDGTPDIRMTTKWTQKGRLFLYDLLKENEVLPDIEKIA